MSRVCQEILPSRPHPHATVHKLIFPKQPKDITSDSDVSVCFERGGKIASSRTQKMQLQNDGSTVEIIFEEALSLVVTMYREDSGKYQVLNATLSPFS